MKLLQAADEVLAESTGCCTAAAGFEPKLMPEADAVMTTAAPATATAPTAKPATRR
jgi:hypothetical protein